METLTLTASFIAALIVSGSVVYLFSDAIDTAVTRALPGDLGEIWARFAKFAVFVSSVASGMSIEQLKGLAGGMSQGSSAAAGPGQSVFDVFRTIIGCLKGAGLMLLIVLGIPLALY